MEALTFHCSEDPDRFRKFSLIRHVLHSVGKNWWAFLKIKIRGKSWISDPVISMKKWPSHKINEIYKKGFRPVLTRGVQIDDFQDFFLEVSRLRYEIFVKLLPVHSQRVYFFLFCHQHFLCKFFNKSRFSKIFATYTMKFLIWTPLVQRQQICCKFPKIERFLWGSLYESSHERQNRDHSWGDG